MRDKDKTKPKLGLESLMAIPTVSATEFADWAAQDDTNQNSPATQLTLPFASDQAYRFCRAVVAEPMKFSSVYPRLAGISPKSAKAIRQELVDKGFIREHLIDSGRRGRSTIRLEPLLAARVAISQYKSPKE